MSSLPLQFLLLTVAGWMTRDQQRVAEYLLAENTVLREQLRGRRLRYTDAQRNHQGIGNQLIVTANDNAAIGGHVLRRQRLGGVLHNYHRAAA